MEMVVINVCLSALPRCPARTPAHTPNLLHFLLSLGVYYGLVALCVHVCPRALVLRVNPNQMNDGGEKLNTKVTLKSVGFSKGLFPFLAARLAACHVLRPNFGPVHVGGGEICPGAWAGVLGGGFTRSTRARGHQARTAAQTLLSHNAHLRYKRVGFGLGGAGRRDRQKKHE